MNRILFFLFFVVLMSFGCASRKKAKTVVVTEGITGQVVQETGNRMPMKGVTASRPKGIQTTVYIYEPTHISQVNREGTAPVYTVIRTSRVTAVETDSLGFFQVALAPGKYSLFVKHGDDKYYANLFDEKNNIAIHEVEKGKLTKTVISITTSATY